MNYDVFISHASEDKDFVRALYNALVNQGLSVWYDNFSLTVGDKLRRSIDDGLANSRYGIIIISNNFFAKEWPQKELDGLASREVSDEKVILPVWHNISFEEVSKRSPMLADRVAVSSDRGVDDVVSQLLRAMKPPAPAAVLAPKRHHKSLQERLLSYGVNINTDLQQEGVLDLLGAKFAIDDVIVDAEFAGFQGVTSHQLSVVSATRDHPQLPDYVYEARKDIPPPEPNKKKAYLESWSPPIIDQGNKASLYVGHLDARVPEKRYDYWTTLAVRETIPRLQQELMSGALRLRELARRMDVILVVVTADDQLVLARRSNHVADAQGQWMASVGESIDSNHDLDQNQVPSPLEAARRCLVESDELNLSSSDASSARLRILGIATEWRWLYANLIVLVELNVGIGRVKERFSEAEHTCIEGLNFTAEACLPLIRLGRYESAPIVPASRVALLMSLMSRFGYDEIVERIA